MFQSSKFVRSRRGGFVGLLLLLGWGVLGCVTTLSPSFSHQGRLLDSSGNPVPDGSYTVEYRLFHSETGGSSVYTETASIQIEDGYFDSAFGGAGVDSKIFSQQTWLEISVNGETLEPRELLRGAPYASGLVSGSAAIGPEPVDYTYGTTNNLGSAFFAVNTDLSPTGGSGITAITTAQIPDSDPGNRTSVAAVRGIAVDVDNDTTTGTYAGIFVSEDFRGLYATGSSHTYAAWFAGDVRITGSCSGCAMALTAQNVGTEAIEVGDFVMAVGVEVDPEYQFPILLVQKAKPGETVVGVADSRLERGAYIESALAESGFDKAAGRIESGEYVLIVTEGLVQARVASSTTLQVGDFLSASGSEAAEAAEAAERGASLGQVLSEPDENGLRWILLNR